MTFGWVANTQAEFLLGYFSNTNAPGDYVTIIGGAGPAIYYQNFNSTPVLSLPPNWYSDDYLIGEWSCYVRQTGWISPPNALLHFMDNNNPGSSSWKYASYRMTLSNERVEWYQKCFFYNPDLISGMYTAYGLDTSLTKPAVAGNWSTFVSAIRIEGLSSTVEILTDGTFGSEIWTPTTGVWNPAWASNKIEYLPNFSSGMIEWKLNSISLGIFPMNPTALPATSYQAFRFGLIIPPTASYTKIESDSDSFSVYSSVPSYGYYKTDLVPVPLLERVNEIYIQVSSGDIANYVTLDILDMHGNLIDQYITPISTTTTLTQSDFPSLLLSTVNDVQLKFHFYSNGISAIKLETIGVNFIRAQASGNGDYVAYRQPEVTLMVSGSPLVAFNYWESIQINTRINSLSDVLIKIPNNEGQFSNRFPNETEVEVWLNWADGVPQLFWKGKTEKYQITKEKKASYIMLWGRDKARIFENELVVDDDFVNYPQFTGTYGELIQYLNAQLSAVLAMSFTESDGDLDIVKTFNYEKSIDDLIEAAEYGGYEWYYEPRLDRLIVRPPRTLVESNVVKTYLLGSLADFGEMDLSSYALMKSDDLTVDSSDRITRVRVDNDEGLVSIYPASLPSLIKELHQSAPEVMTQPALDQLAVNLYNSKRFDRISLSIEIPFGEDSVLLGDIVKCDDSKYGLSTVTQKLYRVIEISHQINKRGGWNTSLGLGDFTPKITDFL